MELDSRMHLMRTRTKGAECRTSYVAHLEWQTYWMYIMLKRNVRSGCAGGLGSFILRDLLILSNAYRRSCIDHSFLVGFVTDTILCRSYIHNQNIIKEKTLYTHHTIDLPIFQQYLSLEAAII
mmetsp:Transcript_28546/g.84038  ORF Transcript_28546/g.84038 Transcript_28546/m.84038 type:complete len:123 (+) Transcript_28546:317-685(+)